MSTNNHSQKIISLAKQLIKNILSLAQSSLSEHQYAAFRKLTLDYHGDFQRSLFGDQESDQRDLEREPENNDF